MGNLRHLFLILCGILLMVIFAVATVIHPFSVVARFVAHTIILMQFPFRALTSVDATRQDSLHPHLQTRLAVLYPTVAKLCSQMAAKVSAIISTILDPNSIDNIKQILIQIEIRILFGLNLMRRVAPKPILPNISTQHRRKESRLEGLSREAKYKFLKHESSVSDPFMGKTIFSSIDCHCNGKRIKPLKDFAEFGDDLRPEKFVPKLGLELLYDTVGEIAKEHFRTDFHVFTAMESSDDVCDQTPAPSPPRSPVQESVSLPLVHSAVARSAVRNRSMSTIQEEEEESDSPVAPAAEPGLPEVQSIASSSGTPEMALNDPIFEKEMLDSPMSGCSETDPRETLVEDMPQDEECTSTTEECGSRTEAKEQMSSFMPVHGVSRKRERDDYEGSDYSEDDGDSSSPRKKKKEEKSRKFQ